MFDGDLVDRLPATLLLIPLAVCCVSWWTLRALVCRGGGGERRGGEPFGAPDPCDADAATAAEAPDQRPRQGPAQPVGVGQTSSSNQQGGARPRRPTAWARSDRTPDDTNERMRAPSPQPTARRRSEAERPASSGESAGANDSRRGRSSGGPRPARPAGAMETPAARRDPAAAASIAGPLGAPPRRAEAPSQAAGHTRRAQQPDSQPTGTPRMPAPRPPELPSRRPRRADDTSQGGDDRFVTRPRPDAAARVTEVNSLQRAVIAEYAQRFEARWREGWVQNTLEPAEEPTPSTLRAKRHRARTAVM